MKHKVAVAICLILIVMTVGFIWNNSRLPTVQSHDASDTVAQKVEQVVTENGHKEASASFKVSLLALRKAAHAIEFFALGIEISVLSFIVKKRFMPQSLWNIISSALAIAVVDESIQILSGRGPLVKDILIDMCGAMAGFLLALLVRFIIISCKKGKRYGKN